MCQKKIWSWKKNHDVITLILKKNTKEAKNNPQLIYKDILFFFIPLRFPLTQSGHRVLIILYIPALLKWFWLSNLLNSWVQRNFFLVIDVWTNSTEDN